jgi:hypothetical protein
VTGGAAVAANGNEIPTLEQVTLWLLHSGLDSTNANEQGVLFINYNNGRGWPLKWENAIEVWLTKIETHGKPKNGTYNGQRKTGLEPDPRMAEIDRVLAEQRAKRLVERG